MEVQGGQGESAPRSGARGEGVSVVRTCSVPLSHQSLVALVLCPCLQSDRDLESGYVFGSSRIALKRCTRIPCHPTGWGGVGWGGVGWGCG